MKILHDSRNYRIEQHDNTPLPVALDRKERSDGATCLVNIGWYASYSHALTAMSHDSQAGKMENWIARPTSGSLMQACDDPNVSDEQYRQLQDAVRASCSDE